MYNKNSNGIITRSGSQQLFLFVCGGDCTYPSCSLSAVEEEGGKEGRDCAGGGTICRQDPALHRVGARQALLDCPQHPQQHLREGRGGKKVINKHKSRYKLTDYCGDNISKEEILNSLPVIHTIVHVIDGTDSKKMAHAALFIYRVLISKKYQ